MTEGNDWYARYRRRVERKRLLLAYGNWIAMGALPPELRTKAFLKKRVKAHMEQTP